MKEHLVIPDTQVRPGVDISHMVWIGKYAVAKRPDVIVHLGDHWDMASLCSYDEEKPDEFNRRRIRADIDAGNKALENLTNELAKASGYHPKLIILRGNHEQRIERLLDEHPRIQGMIGYQDFNDVALGWKPVPYMKPVTVDGVSYCHLYCKSSNGLVTNTKWGAPNAKTMVMREMRSCTAGHKPGLSTHIQPTGGKSIRGLIAGSCYSHNEDYHSPQGNRYWRGILYKHEVYQGNYDLMEVSLNYLKRKFGVTHGKGNIARVGTAKKAT